MTMTDDLARIAEVLEDSATRATNAVQRQIMTSNAAVIRDAKARIEALTAERDSLIQTSAIYCDDCGWAMSFPDCGCVYCGFHRLEKERDALTADNARLRAALNETAQILSQCTFETIRVRGQYIDRREAVSRARAALNTGKEPNHD